MSKLSHSNPALDNVLGQETAEQTPTPWMLEWHKEGYVVTAEAKHPRGHTFRHNVLVIGGQTLNKALFRANAEFICRSCNSYYPMLELLKLAKEQCDEDTKKRIEELLEQNKN